MRPRGVTLIVEVPGSAILVVVVLVVVVVVVVFLNEYPSFLWPTCLAYERCTSNPINFLNGDPLGVLTVFEDVPTRGMRLSTYLSLRLLACLARLLWLCRATKPMHVQVTRMFIDLFRFLSKGGVRVGVV